MIAQEATLLSPVRWLTTVNIPFFQLFNPRNSVCHKIEYLWGHPTNTSDKPESLLETRKNTTGISCGIVLSQNIGQVIPKNYTFILSV